jgi:hypothetical protein
MPHKLAPIAIQKTDDNDPRSAGKSILSSSSLCPDWRKIGCSREQSTDMYCRGDNNAGKRGHSEMMVRPRATGDAGLILLNLATGRPNVVWAASELTPLGRLSC